MNTFRSFGTFRTVLVLAVAAAAVCVSMGPAYGTGIQVSLQSSFNADDVRRYSGGSLTTPSITWDNPAAPSSDSWMVTQSAANYLAEATSVGINDNGFYPATGAQTYDVQLGFTNATPTGTNVAIRVTEGGTSFSFNTGNNQYSQFAIFGSSGSGNSTLTITLNYASGSPTVLTGVTLPDWYSGPGGTAGGAAGTFFALTPAMARDHQVSGYQGPIAAGGAYIYGINLAPDPTRQLTSVTVLVTALASPGSTAANFLTAAGALATSTSLTPAPGTLLLLLTGLTLVTWFSLRRRRTAL